jgi:hypothetical protein
VRDHRLPARGESTQGVSAATPQEKAMSKSRPSKHSTRPKPSRRIKQRFPPGWNERKVRAVIQHYEQLTDEELAREIETAPEIAGETLISVPTELLPAIRSLILGHHKSA